MRHVQRGINLHGKLWLIGIDGAIFMSFYRFTTAGGTDKHGKCPLYLLFWWQFLVIYVLFGLCN